MRRFFAALLIFALAIPIIALTGSAKKLPKPEGISVKPDKLYRATVETTMGSFEIELYSKLAPYTVTNFIYLAKARFYDGLIFHRVVPGHVVQGGCPRGDGYGDAGYTIPAEINEKKHIIGAVGMARDLNDLGSAGSQFYICLAPRPQLDGKFTVFGQVTKGLDVIEKMGKVPTTGQDGNPPDRPLNYIHIRKITIQESPRP